MSSVKSLAAQVTIKRNGYVIVLPKECYKINGFMKQDVLVRLTALTRENIQFLEEKYGVKFYLEAA